jgi:hypothetical protein
MHPGFDGLRSRRLRRGRGLGTRARRSQAAVLLGLQPPKGFVVPERGFQTMQIDAESIT